MTTPRPSFNYNAPIESPPGGAPGLFAARPHLPYLLPFLAYLLVMLPGSLPTLAGIDFAKLWFNYLPFVYFTKTLLAAILLIALWKYYTPIRWQLSHLPLGLLIGLLGTVLWIASTYAAQALGLSQPPAPATLYNPDHMLPIDWQRWLFLFIRVAGPTLVVPIMEELFFRDFLMRALVAGIHFDDIPVGTFSWLSLLVMSAAFAFNHGPMMLVPGFLYGLLMGLLVIRTKSLAPAIIAHGMTNFSLYLYCIYTGDWQFM
jgi:uncharacterized protein